MLTGRQFTLSWTTSAAASILLPLAVFSIARLTNSDGENRYQGQDNGNNNYYTQDDCKWYQWGCSDMYSNGNGNQNQEQNGLPWWWLWSEDERRREDATNPTLVAIYIWSLILFGILVFYGYRIQKSEKYDTRITIGALLVFANLTFLGMLFIGGLEGGVQDDGPELEENGFYGQFGVLLFMTYLCFTVFSIAFAIILRRQMMAVPSTRIDIDEKDYQAYESPKVSFSSAKETV